ncbi:GGDEF domain-containing protein [Acetivibrio sp. MSJd-27]|uniref:GGDEF domain-containing protein n=1 Tax=Acetivibrio sp. MSJd-27 TaxID=2841523 RepID=UPI001C110498|nr:GGDEF domain-containing protein [Acetivibrio sp. MSJd-27]MBU5450262.1 GGDEF domain-containing protein [Acetivibrio sp. MSJd-27]
MTDAFINVLSISCILILFLILCESRYSVKKTWIIGISTYMVCSAAYLFGLSLGMFPALSSALFLTIPSFFLCGSIAKYRDFRYIFTFCTVDIFGTIILGISNILNAIYDLSEVFMLLWTAILFAAAFYVIYRIHNTYKEIQRALKKGWGGLALLSIFFYLMLYLTIGYPAPLVQRLEYAPVVLAYFALILAVYAVLFQFIKNMRKNYEFHQNEQLLKIQLELKNSQLKEQELYHKLAYIDPLTQLFNRAALGDEEKSIIRNPWNYLPFCCVLLDLNNLKYVNDTFGHMSGDEIICGLAGVLIKCFSSDGKTYRIGGDEFLVTLPRVSAEKLPIHIQKIKDGISAYNKNHKLPISAAMGTAVLYPTDTNDIPQDAFQRLYHEADDSMYRDKQKQKKQSDFYF